MQTTHISQLTIRPLCACDLDRIFGPRSRPHGEEWRARQARAEVYIAVAELHGVPVGRVGLDFILHAEDGAAFRAAFLFSAHVEPDFQSRGVGTALFLHLEQIALGRGYNVIQLDVGKENPRARSLYERLGYKVCGEEIARWSYRDGERVIEVAEDCLIMRKHLTKDLTDPNTCSMIPLSS